MSVNAFCDQGGGCGINAAMTSSHDMPPLDWRKPVRTLARLPVKGYRYTLSSVMGRTCRHLPSCSEYMDEAIGRHGFWAGGWTGAARLCRCHPWGTAGFDPVPLALPRAASWWRPWRYGRWSWRALPVCDVSDEKSSGA